MKRFLSIILLTILIIPFALGEGFNYTATVRDANGSLLTGHSIQLRVSILLGSATGSATYVEQFATTTNAYGVASVVVGNGTSISGDFSSIDWSKDLYLKSEVSANADGNFTEIATTEIAAVPYSMHSNSANALTLTSPNGSHWSVSADNSGNLVSTPLDASSTPEYGTVDYIFDKNALPTITVEISTAEWNKLLTNFDTNPNNEDCVVANLYFNKYGVINELDSIGLRLRGNTSRVRPEGATGELHNATNPDWHHCHFGFRFAKFKDSNSLSGTDRVDLRWANNDPTYVHEMYSYDMMRRFGIWTAPKSSYCRLKIKIKEDQTTAYYGVYEMFESPDDQYLADRAALGKIKKASGFLWKMSWGSGVCASLEAGHADGSLMGIENIQLTGTSTSFTYDYKSKKKKFDTAKAQFMQFISNLNTKTGDDFVAWADTTLDVDLLLRATAATVALGQWDDYWCNGNNYYLYFDTDGKCYYVPYDFDNALGTSSSALMYNPGTQDPLNWGSSTNRPLVTKILAVDKWKTLYKKYLADLISADNDYFDADKSIARIKAWQAKIKDYVKNDTGEDGAIYDKSASWSTGITNYRLLTGDDNGGTGSTDPNFFRTRIKTIKAAVQ
ncbi:MAG: CotH kinase family protein [Muribaculaceae bacterium]|jgi:spore coat protein H|nr:CotH kinase family protein [Muribaculaceae bacterium]